MEESQSPSLHFSGSIPKRYDEFLGPLYFEPYAVDVSKRMEGLNVKLVLELASGTGRVTHHLRKVIPREARIVASDISADMLQVAQEKLKGLKNIDWQIIDAQQLPFEDNSIDLIVCCFGYMFVSDKLKAFHEAHRVLQQQGTLLFTTWDKLEHNEASFVFRSIVKKYFGNTLPESYGLPFAMHDPEAIRKMLHEAGFSKTAAETVRKLSFGNTAKEIAYGLAHGGALYNEIMNRNPAWLNEILSETEKDLTEKFGAAPMIAPMQALIFQAWK